MKVDVLTLFPGMFGGVFAESILRIAREKRILDVRVWNIRDFTSDRHRTVDDRPYGGGPGMVMKVEPVLECDSHVLATRVEEGGEDAKVILLTPQGERFNQAKAREYSEEPHLVLICGHYEGFDERIRLALEPEELSIGDYVLSGGEAAAMVVIDAVTRLIPGVLGSNESVREESFSHGDQLEYPQYTRPAEYRGMDVPDVLRSGNHAKIRAWREEKSRERTESRRHKERSDEAS
jgi:tRNA (guanine37-N1)-methyltransferase